MNSLGHSSLPPTALFRQDDEEVTSGFPDLGGYQSVPSIGQVQDITVHHSADESRPERNIGNIVQQLLTVIL
ncbi:hypothetical protein TNCV_2008721 [Trichonephila clavipes]|nr:hypothetical protein TNCV_2008721 [Trichonephila clavipes]